MLRLFQAGCLSEPVPRRLNGEHRLIQDAEMRTSTDLEGGTVPVLLSSLIDVLSGQSG